ncbi:DUF3575 domain-containing protein [Polaribacter sp.]|uniref:DUF3575 domain-containing protein n=1 Tax=Polaribacter sp. TaxID=1920175 RepID=UPI0025CE8FCA|nr:DUF3575 domain-containing protein [Polaribacter sp.]
MKKFITSLFLMCTVFAFAQKAETKYPQDQEKKYELKLNTFNLIAFASLDVSYEKLVNENSSLGIALFYNFSDENSDIIFEKKFSLTPYYRWFFSESRFARGFFVEGFGMLNNFKDDYYLDNYYIDDYAYENTSQIAFALGVSVGGKFVTKTGFTTEIYLGIGRNLIKSKKDDNYFLNNDIVGRFGISIGYRF